MSFTHLLIQSLQNSKGQATIVLVLIMSIIVLMFTHVVTLSFSNVQVSDEGTLGEYLQMKAEGYLENGAIRYLRDGTYTGETVSSLIEPDYSCIITVTDIGGPEGLDRDFESTCSLDGRSRTVGMQATYNAGIFSFTAVKQR